MSAGHDRRQDAGGASGGAGLGALTVCGVRKSQRWVVTACGADGRGIEQAWCAGAVPADTASGAPQAGGRRVRRKRPGKERGTATPLRLGAPCLVGRLGAAACLQAVGGGARGGHAGRAPWRPGAVQERTWRAPGGRAVFAGGRG